MPRDMVVKTANKKGKNRRENPVFRPRRDGNRCRRRPVSRSYLRRMYNLVIERKKNQNPPRVVACGWAAAVVTAGGWGHHRRRRRRTGYIRWRGASFGGAVATAAVADKRAGRERGECRNERAPPLIRGRPVSARARRSPGGACSI